MSVYIHNKNEKLQQRPGCTVVTYHNANVAIPVTVKPEINTGEINTICYGEPKITKCPYALRCNAKNDKCRFTIIQDIRIAIPIEISANAILDAPFINCEEWNK